MPSDLEITMTRVFEAPRSLVFDVFTKPAHLTRWMTGPEGWTMPVCEVDLRPGGKWRHVYRRDSGSEFEMSGVYSEVTPPERVVSTENWGEPWPESVNTIVFSESDGRTTVALTMKCPTKEARDAAIATGMEDGAEVSFDRLDAYLRTLA
jgi:uncharacterized protein YndB with AHSA1/START domain